MDIYGTEIRQNPGMSPQGQFFAVGAVVLVKFKKHECNLHSAQLHPQYICFSIFCKALTL